MCQESLPAINKKELRVHRALSSKRMRRVTFDINKATITWSNYIERIKSSLSNDSIEMSIHHDNAGASAPVAKKTRLDVVMSYLFLEENIIVEEDHCYQGM